MVRQYAQPVMERALKRFPAAVVPSLPPLLAALTDPAHGEVEEAAVGACTALGGRVLCRQTTRLPHALAQVRLKTHPHPPTPMFGAWAASADSQQGTWG